MVPFDDRFAPLLPDPVREASEAFREALDALEARRGTLAVAQEQLATATAADDAAARHAVAAGKNPPRATAPKAADDAERAERGVTAARDHARDAQNAYLDSVLGHLAELRAAIGERQAAQQRATREALETLAGALREADALAVLAQELHENGLIGKAAMFSPTWPNRPRDPAEEALQVVRARLAPVEVSS